MNVSNVEGEEIEQDYPVAVLWPWDVLAALWESGQFLRWVSDQPSEASDRVEEYWRHCVNLSFFDQLDLQEGGSLETKLVFLLLREQMIVKNKSHDKVGHTIGYVVRTLMTGKYPMTNVNGERFDTSSLQAAKAGLPFAGGWRLCFAAFKGDWEARQVIHKSTRFYNAKYICEHCMASREPQFTYGDFRMNAACMSKRLTHAEYRILQGNKQSSWESDVLHVYHQGVACVLIASLVCDTLESKYEGITLKEMDQRLSQEVYKHYKTWCKERAAYTTACSHRFSLARFGKDTWSTYPELGSIFKAAVVKSMLYWCLDYLRGEQHTRGGDELRPCTILLTSSF
ncbi:unnamed protein product [Durusdinium trenchii]|uniref:Uncharacterized protein n=1 Tax=Durusdinium trenchii TaxID=1381693 RepID=A0ABP0IUP5_9DINO